MWNWIKRANPSEVLYRLLYNIVKRCEYPCDDPCEDPNQDPCEDSSEDPCKDPHKHAKDPRSLEFVYPHTNVGCSGRVVQLSKWFQRGVAAWLNRKYIKNEPRSLVCFSLTQLIKIQPDAVHVFLVVACPTFEGVSATDVGRILQQKDNRRLVISKMGAGMGALSSKLTADLSIIALYPKSQFWNSMRWTKCNTCTDLTNVTFVPYEARCHWDLQNLADEFNLCRLTFLLRQSYPLSIFHHKVIAIVSYNEQRMRWGGAGWTKRLAK